MLFNDFLLLTCAKRPLIAKMFQLLRRTVSAYQREAEYRLDRTSLRNSNLDWFDSPDTEHLYLAMRKKVRDERTTRLIPFVCSSRSCCMKFKTFASWRMTPSVFNSSTADVRWSSSPAAPINGRRTTPNTSLLHGLLSDSYG